MEPFIPAEPAAAARRSVRRAVPAGADVPAPEPNVVPLPPAPHPVPPAPEVPPEVKDPDQPEEHSPVRDPLPGRFASVPLQP